MLFIAGYRVEAKFFAIPAALRSEGSNRLVERRLAAKSTADYMRRQIVDGWFRQLERVVRTHAVGCLSRLYC